MSKIKIHIIKSTKPYFFIGFISSIQFIALAQTSNNIGVLAKNAMVVSAREEASSIGVSILKKGGNAFDAMIATELALAVTFPYAGNIGGGGFMVYRTHKKEIGALDYREKAPLAAKHNMYLDAQGNIIPNKSTEGGLSVGVPGTIDGLFRVHERFGSLPFKNLIQPAIDLANKGIIITEKQAERLNKHQGDFLKINKKATPFNKKLWQMGDTLRFEKLAQTLEMIKKHGRDGFYKGPVAKTWLDFLNRHGGIITQKDLNTYKSIWRKPIQFKYKDLNIISMSPPSSGGIAMAQIFGMLTPYNLKEYSHNQSDYIHLLAEVFRRAYADRAYFLGDPDFVKIPQKELINPNYLKKRMQNFSWENVTPSKEISHGSIKFIESEETTHYSIIDSLGNAVSATTTLNGAYGSKLFVDQLGFFLNNEMDDFSIKPGTPNMFGLIGAKANAIAPGKRMLSSMSPTIVERSGKLYMVLGTPGGSRIITSVLQVILNVYTYGMGMQEAVSEPRFHHQWLPDEIGFEPEKFTENTLNQLQKKGHKMNSNPTLVMGKVDAILVHSNGMLEGGADPRGDDTAVGY